MPQPYLTNLRVKKGPHGWIELEDCSVQVAQASGVMREDRDETQARIIQCINACAGMPDPVADIRRLMEENRRLREMERRLPNADSSDPTQEFCDPPPGIQPYGI